MDLGGQRADEAHLQCAGVGRHVERVETVVVGEAAHLGVAYADSDSNKCLAVFVGDVTRHLPCAVVNCLSVFLCHIDDFPLHGVAEGLVGKKVCHCLVDGCLFQFSCDGVVAYVVVGKHKLVVGGSLNLF